MTEPVEVFELVVVCCLPVAAFFQSQDEPAPSRKLNYFCSLHPQNIPLYRAWWRSTLAVRQSQDTPGRGGAGNTGGGTITRQGGYRYRCNILPALHKYFYCIPSAKKTSRGT